MIKVNDMSKVKIVSDGQMEEGNDRAPQTGVDHPRNSLNSEIPVKMIEVNDMSKVKIVCDGQMEEGNNGAPHNGVDNLILNG